MDKDEITQGLVKKEGQVARTKTKLDSKIRKNLRRKARREKLSDLIDKSEKKIREYKQLIKYHEDMIDDWTEKLLKVPGEEDTTELKEAVEKVSIEYERMEVLGRQILDMTEKIAGEESEPLREAYENARKKYVREFKSEKGHGF